MTNGKPKTKPDIKHRKMLHNFTALTELAAEISSTHNFEEVTRASLHTLLGALAIPRGAIARYTAKPRQLKIVAAKGLGGAVGHRIPLEPKEVELLTKPVTPLAVNTATDVLAAFADRNREILNL